MRVGVGDWFRLNLEIGALSFGGSGRILLFEEGVVRSRAWMKDEEFHEILSVSQFLPGPNLVNLSAGLGFALCGRFGAVLGVVGLCLPGALLVAISSAFIDLDNPHVRLVFQGFSLASISLFLVFILHLGRRLGEDRERALRAFRFGLAIGVFAFAMMNVPLAALLGGGALIGFLGEAWLS